MVLSSTCSWDNFLLWFFSICIIIWLSFCLCWNPIWIIIIIYIFYFTKIFFSCDIYGCTSLVFGLTLTLCILVVLFIGHFCLMSLIVSHFGVYSWYHWFLIILPIIFFTLVFLFIAFSSWIKVSEIFNDSENVVVKPILVCLTQFFIWMERIRSRALFSKLILLLMFFFHTFVQFFKRIWLPITFSILLSIFTSATHSVVTTRDIFFFLLRWFIRVFPFVWWFLIVDYLFNVTFRSWFLFYWLLMFIIFKSIAFLFIFFRFFLFIICHLLFSYSCINLFRPT